jgi:hypothetical protein
MRLFIVLLAVWSVGAHAVLGQKSSSLVAEAAKLQVTQRVQSQTTAYSVVEMQMPNTLIREYVAASGDIIAVSWRGTHRPHLKLILGKYYQHYQNALQSRGRLQRRGPISVSNSEVTLVSVGRPRHFSGKVVLPNTVGLQLGDVQ